MTDDAPDRPVLVAVDFSPTSKAALAWAADAARDQGASLLVLHVVHDPADAPGTYRARARDDDESSGSERTSRGSTASLAAASPRSPSAPGAAASKVSWG